MERSLVQTVLSLPKLFLAVVMWHGLMLQIALKPSMLDTARSYTAAVVVAAAVAAAAADPVRQHETSTI
jgi:hypothetical protein